MSRNRTHVLTLILTVTGMLIGNASIVSAASLTIVCGGNSFPTFNPCSGTCTCYPASCPEGLSVGYNMGTGKYECQVKPKACQWDLTEYQSCN